MSDVDILHQMIKDDAKVPLDYKNGKKQVTLTEPECENHPEYSVIIHGMPEKAIVIKADAFKSPDTVFTGSKGECKRADFVIVADAGNKKVILCIEMKAGKGSSEKEIIQQLKGSQCFVAYCREIGQSFWDMPNFLKGYRYRFISIRDISISKKKTRIDKQTSIHDCPEKMLKISSPHYLQFNHLAGGN